MTVAAVETLDELGNRARLISRQFEVGDEVEAVVHGGHVNPESYYGRLQALGFWLRALGTCNKTPIGTPRVSVLGRIGQRFATTQYVYRYGHSAESYYATFTHESTHWTAHESRLARRPIDILYVVAYSHIEHL